MRRRRTYVRRIEKGHTSGKGLSYKYNKKFYLEKKKKKVQEQFQKFYQG